MLVRDAFESRSTNDRANGTTVAPNIAPTAVVSETMEAAAALMHLVITFNAMQQCSFTLERAETRSASPL